MPPSAPLIPALAVAVLLLLFSLPCAASDTCARATPGKCKVWQTAPPRKGNPGVVTHHAVQPNAKGNHKGRDQYTAAERDKILEAARSLCRRAYGAPSTVYRVDYKRATVWCNPPAY